VRNIRAKKYYVPNFYISKGPFVSLAHLNAFSSPRGKGQNISFSIEDNQYYVLFKIIAGPEAVLRQPLEDMKVFECPEVLEFNQIFDLSRVSWLWVEIFLSPLSPFSPHRPRMSKCLNFSISGYSQ